MTLSLAPIIALVKRIPDWAIALGIFLLTLKVVDLRAERRGRKKSDEKNRQTTQETMEAIEDASEEFEDMAERIRDRSVPDDIERMPDGKVRLPPEDRRG